MTIANHLMVWTFKSITSLICRIDDEQLVRVPERGPLILVGNHVNLIEIPILYTRLQPRPVTGLVLARRWDKFWTRWLLEVAGAIPLRRGEADIAAFRMAEKMLASGYIISIAPEGTRSGDGCLSKAHAGVVSLALHSRAPLLPVVFYGGERYVHNLLRLQRTDFHIIVGQPFYLNPGGEKVTRQIRQQILNEIMYQLATLLPPKYRGVYADLSSATQRYLNFE
ncbi:MAG: 1-acyl-sn-glycerol-3-phosphate acyltransferase [Anaerolineales bacterium]|nr:1-acyl-sn-glycerol-3-phosphate acyltransferase [Anaerolineales bacterium]